jgi:hypothetical protein
MSWYGRVMMEDFERRRKAMDEFERSLSEFERAMFARLSAFEQFQVLTLLDAGIAGDVRDALREVREFEERSGK